MRFAAAAGSRKATASDGDTPTASASSNSLEYLESLRLSQLKELAKSLGVKPSGLRKAEFVQACYESLLQKWDGKSSPDSLPESTSSAGMEEETSSESTAVSIGSNTTDGLEPPRYKRARNLRPLPLSELTFASGAAKVSSSTETTGPEQEAGPVSYSEKFKFPYGPLRDSRLSSEQETADMDITFLGTASCIPSISRGVSCTAFRFHSDMWLFDCGEASQLQLQKSRVKASKIKKIFLTHLHGDHSFGLPGVLCMIGQATQEERELQRAQGWQQPTGGAQPESPPMPDSGVIDIYGPEGTRDMVRATIQLTYSRVVAPFRVHELKNVPYLHGRCVKWRPPDAVVRTRLDPAYGEQPGGRDIFPDEQGHYHVLAEGELTVQAAPMQHTVPCVGFVVTEATRPGKLRIELVQPLVDRQREALKAQLKLKDANKVYAALKEMLPGQTFAFPDGTILTTEEFLDPPKRGRKVVIMGDTCTGEHIAALAKDADVLVHEATNAYLPEIDKSTRYTDYNRLERDTFNHGHSTPQMAGRFAHRIGAKRLVLTHFSPRYRGEDDERSMRIMWRIEDQARSKAPGLLGKNDVLAAWDYLFLPVGLV